MVVLTRRQRALKGCMNSAKDSAMPHSSSPLAVVDVISASSYHMLRSLAPHMTAPDAWSFGITIWLVVSTHLKNISQLG